MTLQRRKEIGIVAFVVLYTVLFFLLIALLLHDSQAWLSLSGALVGLAALVWVALFGTATAFLINRPGVNFLLAAVPAVIVLVIGLFSLESLIGAVLLGAFLFIAQRRLARDMQSRVQFRPRIVLYGATKVVMLGLLVSVITLTLPVIRAQVSAGSLVVPEEAVAAVLRPASPLIARFIPNYQLSTTVDDVINAQLANQTGSPATGGAEFIVQRGALRTELSRQLQIELQGNETLPRLISSYLSGYISQLANQRGLVVVALLIIVLLAIRALVPLLTWPTLGFITVLVYMSERIGLVTIIKTQVTVERLSL